MPYGKYGEVIMNDCIRACRPWDSAYAETTEFARTGAILIKAHLTIDQRIDAQALIDHCLCCTKEKCDNCLSVSSKRKAVLNGT